MLVEPLATRAGEEEAALTSQEEERLKAGVAVGAAIVLEVVLLPLVPKLAIALFRH